MFGKIKGWNFKRAYSADGSSTIESLTADKNKLEARLVEIPKLITQLNHSITVAQNDINWVKSLGNLKKKKWEKEKGVVAEEWIRNAENNVVKMQGQVSSLTTEKSRIPDQIKSIQTQIDALVAGESKGLEKGWDKETAREMGQLELEQEKARLENERAIREQELQLEKERQIQQDKAAEEAKSGKNQTKIFIGIGIVLLLAIGGYILYRRKVAKKAVA